jgi:hypothetical protein
MTKNEKSKKSEIIIDQFMFDILKKVELKIIFIDRNDEEDYSIMDIDTMEEYIYVMSGEYKKECPTLKPIELIYKNVSHFEMELFNKNINNLKKTMGF